MYGKTHVGFTDKNNALIWNKSTWRLTFKPFAKRKTEKSHETTNTLLYTHIHCFFFITECNFSLHILHWFLFHISFFSPHRPPSPSLCLHLQLLGKHKSLRNAVHILLAIKLLSIWLIECAASCIDASRIQIEGEREWKNKKTECSINAYI